MAHVAVPQQIRRAFTDWKALGRPAQSSVEWQRERWLEKLPDLAPTFNALPDRLDRQAVRAIVLGAPATAAGMFDAMVAVYAWGWSTTPVGVARGRTVLQAGHAHVGARLYRSGSGYTLRAPLRGIGHWRASHASQVLAHRLAPTPLLCVGGRAAGADPRRLVYDWLHSRLDISFAPTRWVRRGYKRYLDLMAGWGEELEVQAHVLEEVAS